MTSHIGEIASVLKNFVEANYPASAASAAAVAGNTLDAYKALFLVMDGCIMNSPNRFYNLKLDALGGREAAVRLYANLLAPLDTECSNFHEAYGIVTEDASGTKVHSKTACP